MRAGALRWAGPSGHAAVAAQKSAKPFIGDDVTAARWADPRRDQPTAESLVGALEVVVRDELAQRAAQVSSSAAGSK